jgi:hypothetical protein
MIKERIPPSAVPVMRALGLTLDEVRDMPVDQMRSKAEAYLGRRPKVISCFPFIGSGVNRERTITHEEVEAALDLALA